MDVAESAGADDDLGSASEGEAEAAAIGAPKQESHFRKEVRSRKTKMLNWLRDVSTLPKLMVWQCLSPSIMHVHAVFFKHGGLHPDSDGKSALFDCMSLSRSQPSKALHTLCCSFDADKPEHGEVRKLMLAWYGLASTWSPVILNHAVASGNILCGNIWRRFYMRYRSYPGLLQVIVDTSIAFDKRLAAAKKFMDARGCCVDEHFSEQFRNMLQD